MPDTSRTIKTLCAYPKCNRAVWKDPDGSFSSFCGKSHRDAMKDHLDTQSMCKMCGVRPVYVENGKRRNFCGVRCGKAFRTGGSRSPAVIDTSSQLVRDGPLECKFIGCTRPVFVRENEASEFCSNKHRLDAVSLLQTEACIRCREWPKATVHDKLSEFCGTTCRDLVRNEAPTIIPLAEGDQTYMEVSKQFSDGWKHLTPVPNIQKIWKIYCRKDLRDKFEQYRLKLERETGMNSGKTVTRWHGTVRACSLGDYVIESNFCTDTRCSLCCIIRSSFDVAEFGKRKSYGRFGEGIYTTATSSKANDYAKSLSSDNTLALLLNQVAVGKPFMTMRSIPDLEEPPSGRHSVIGKPGKDLNYDECTVYDNDAIRPMFLVIYQYSKETK